MPTVRDLRKAFDPERRGAEMYELVRELFPICRSITGDGVRRTLEILSHKIPVETREVASGTAVFDWNVPKEWNVREAWIKGPDAEKIVDFADSNLHLVSYSVPVRARLSLEELRPHLHSLPDHPDWIPYRTSYYQEGWGFCLPHRKLKALTDGDYEVFIDSTLEDGKLTWGELSLPGERDEEILVSTHICHPSLANDNLSGIAVAAWLADLLATVPRRYGYRFLFVPGTIGAIAWLALNEGRAERIRGGLVAANLGDAGPFTYKRSRQGKAEIDRAVLRALADSGGEHRIEDFSPFGYDERQYCSPGFDLAVGSLTRTPHGRYAEYHTSADNLTFIRPRHLGESLARYLAVVEILELDRRFLNLQPKCEPQLGRRGLYRQLGGGTEGRQKELALLWVLNLSDGEHSLLDVAERSGMPFPALWEAAESLREASLLRAVEGGG